MYVTEEIGFCVTLFLWLDHELQQAGMDLRQDP